MSFLSGMVWHLARPPGSTLHRAHGSVRVRSRAPLDEQIGRGIPELDFVARRICFEENVL